MGCEITVRRLVRAIEQRDQECVEALLAPSVAWDTGAGEGGPETLNRSQLAGFLERLEEHNDQRQVKEVTAIAGSIVVRTEGTISPPGGIRYTGTSFVVYDCDERLVSRRRVFGYRKDVLDALAVPQDERQGLLVVRDDDDDRLYHFGIARGSAMTWARYADLGTSDHHHCEICWAKFSALHADYQQEGYATLDGRRWLCRDCFDEVKDHFALEGRQAGGV